MPNNQEFAKCTRFMSAYIVRKLINILASCKVYNIVNHMGKNTICGTDISIDPLYQMILKYLEWFQRLIKGTDRHCPS
jgi:hypothetical protein